MWYLPEQYLTEEVAEKTKYKSIKDAYERNNFSVIGRGRTFYVEGYGCSNRTYVLVIKETKRIFPYMRYLYDIV